MGEIKQMLREVILELRKLTGRPAEEVSVTRKEAARRMGMSLSKLNGRIRAGEIATCRDVHLIPVAEIRRYSQRSDEVTQEQEAPTALSIAHRKSSTYNAKAEAEKIRALAKKKR